MDTLVDTLASDQPQANIRYDQINPLPGRIGLSRENAYKSKLSSKKVSTNDIIQEQRSIDYKAGDIPLLSPLNIPKKSDD